MFIHTLALFGMATLTLACPPHNYHALLHRSVEGEGKPAFDYIASEDWGALSPEFSTCSTGSQQAPIGLRLDQGMATTHIPSLEGLNVNATGLLGNNGFGVSMTFAHPIDNITTLPGLSFDNETVYCIGWHAHTPSDHMVDGHRMRAEMHFVFATTDGSPRAVIAIFVSPGGSASPFLDTLPELVSFTEAENRTVEMGMNIRTVMSEVDDMRQFWTYQGSLTTPPCTEGLRFFVARQPMSVTTEQLQNLLRVGRFSGRVEQQIWNQQLNV